MLSGQLYWLESQLNNTNKPVLIWTHTGIPRGKPDLYDDIGPRARQQYSNLLSKFDNVICTFFGHSHYDQQGSAGLYTIYHRSLVDRYRGLPHIYQHYPHRLGTEEDETITPFADISVRQDGEVTADQSYAGENTGYRDHFDFNGSSWSVSTLADEIIDQASVSWGDEVTSLEGYVANESNGGTVSVQTSSSDPAYYEIDSSATSGDYAMLTARRTMPIYHLEDAIH